MSEKPDRYQELRRAFKARDVSASKKAHQIPMNREGGFEAGTYLGDAVFAAIDGIVTTFAVVSGVAGAELPVGIVLILGLANLFADGTSMTVGNYLGMKSRHSYIRKERERELWEIDKLPEEEEKEVYEILRDKGLPKGDSKELVAIIRKYPGLWADFMMSEELQLTEEKSPEVNHALATWISFTVAGSVPLIAPFAGYFNPVIKEHEFLLSILFTLFALFLTGVLRSRVTLEPWWKSAFQIVLLGSVAAAIAYATGFLLKGIAS